MLQFEFLVTLIRMSICVYTQLNVMKKTNSIIFTCISSSEDEEAVTPAEEAVAPAVPVPPRWPPPLTEFPAPGRVCKVHP